MSLEESSVESGLPPVAPPDEAAAPPAAREASAEPPRSLPADPAGDAASPAADEGASPPAADPAGPLRAELAGIAERLADLQSQAREANRIAEHREQGMDRMHEELVALRAGELFQAMMPVLRGLVRLYDDLDRASQAYSERGEPVAARDFGLFRDAVADILYGHGVEPYTASPGERFEPKAQRALAAVPTDDPALDRTIARVVRRGFRSDTKLVRMMEVEVHRHDSVAASGASGATPNPTS